jgi:Family of unknown function (DUF5683)
MKWFLHILICIFCIVINVKSNKLFAQDSLAKKITDSAKIKMAEPEKEINYFAFNTKNPVPKRAAMYSAILPGLGQAYNKQYWKIPIVYAGVAVSAYITYNTFTDWQKYRQAFITRTDNNPKTIDSLLQYDVNALRELERSNRAYLDRVVVYSAVYYGLNIIDALVSAHLKNFDVSKNISLQPMPIFNNNNIAGFGISAKIKF